MRDIGTDKAEPGTLPCLQFVFKENTVTCDSSLSLESNAFKAKHSNAMTCKASHALQSNVMQCNFRQSDFMGCESQTMQCIAKHCESMQSNAKQQNTVTCDSSLFFHTAMQIKARQGNAEQCKTFVLSVSSDERKPPNWGRAGLIDTCIQRPPS